MGGRRRHREMHFSLYSKTGLLRPTSISRNIYCTPICYVLVPLLSTLQERRWPRYSVFSRTRENLSTRENLTSTKVTLHEIKSSGYQRELQLWENERTYKTNHSNLPLFIDEEMRSRVSVLLQVVLEHTQDWKWGLLTSNQGLFAIWTAQLLLETLPNLNCFWALACLTLLQEHNNISNIFLYTTKYMEWIKSLAKPSKCNFPTF